MTFTDWFNCCGPSWWFEDLLSWPIAYQPRPATNHWIYTYLLIDGFAGLSILVVSTAPYYEANSADWSKYWSCDRHHSRNTCCCIVLFSSHIPSLFWSQGHHFYDQWLRQAGSLELWMWSARLHKFKSNVFCQLIILSPWWSAAKPMVGNWSSSRRFWRFIDWLAQHWLMFCSHASQLTTLSATDFTDWFNCHGSISPCLHEGLHPKELPMDFKQNLWFCMFFMHC